MADHAVSPFVQQRPWDALHQAVSHNHAPYVDRARRRHVPALQGQLSTGLDTMRPCAGKDAARGETAPAGNDATEASDFCSLQGRNRPLTLSAKAVSHSSKHGIAAQSGTKPEGRKLSGSAA